MDLKGIRDLKSRVIRDVIAEKFNGNSSSQVLAQNMLNEPAENRIAVGFSKLEDKDYRLEFRVQKEDRQGHILAQQGVEYAEERGAKANIEVIPKIRIPTLESVSEAPHATPVAPPGGKLEIGNSIGHADGNAGSLGAFLEKEDGIYLLSCSHVIALSGAIATGVGITHYIYHPGKTKGSTIKGSQRIATLSEFTVLTHGENEIDAAAAKVLPGWAYDGNRIPLDRGYINEGKAITMPKTPLTLERDREICKIGRSSGQTVGVVRAIELDFIPIEYTYPQAIRGTYLFNGLTEIKWKSADEPFSLPGDSGSLAFTHDTQEAVGLVFAGGERGDGAHVSYCINLQPILSEFDAKLLVG